LSTEEATHVNCEHNSVFNTPIWKLFIFYSSLHTTQQFVTLVIVF